MENLVATVTTMVGASKEAMKLFVEFPLNVFVSGSVIVSIFKIIRAGKRAAK